MKRPRRAWPAGRLTPAATPTWQDRGTTLEDNRRIVTATEPDAVEIGRATIDAIMRHAQAALPNECCGLLIGSAHRIESAVPARNLKASPTRFQVDPVDHFAAIRSARAGGQRVIGAYHSHPTTAPTPSSTDVDEAGPGDDLWVIVTPTALARAGPVAAWFGAYRFRHTGVTRVRVAIEETAPGPPPAGER